MRYFCFALCFLLLAGADARAATSGISGKWHMQGNGGTLLIDEGALTIYLGDRPMSYTIEEDDGTCFKAKLVRDGIPFGEFTLEKKSADILLFERAGSRKLYLREGVDFSVPDKPIEGRWAAISPNRVVTFDFDRHEVQLSLPRLPKPEQLTLGFSPLFSNEEGHFVYVAGERRGFTWLTGDFLLMCDAIPAGDDPESLRLDKGRCLFMESAP